MSEPDSIRILEPGIPTYVTFVTFPYCGKNSLLPKRPNTGEPSRLLDCLAMGQE
jgi:hypothetical protein